MAPGSSIQRPYAIASLPRPVNQSTGRYVVGDVHGGTPGSRKRKRTELAVGIDGEGLNLYDVQESRLVTSYALPPQSSFTCSPCSIRIKEKANNSVIRRSYTSTVNDSACITLFQDVTVGEQTTISSTAKYEPEKSNFPVVYMNTLTPRDNEVSDLLLVRKDGQIKCLGGEKLNEIWTSSPSAIGRVDGTSNYIGHDVLYVQLTDAHTASKGLLKGLGNVPSGFASDIPTEGHGPEILVLITAPNSSRGPKPRTLHIVALPRLSYTSATPKGRSQSVQNLVSVTLPDTTKHTKRCDSIFILHAPTGILSELCDGTLTTMDLVESIPKVQKMDLTKSAQSFLRLSSTAIMTSSTDSVDLYNPKYMSLQTTFNLSAIDSADSKKRKRKSLDSEALDSFNPCRLHSYFSKLGLAIGITGSELVALQVEISPERPGKRRASGLLIDSLGCGVGSQKRAKTNKAALSNTSFQGYLPVLSDEDWIAGKAALDDLVGSDDVDRFDNLMANYFGTTTNQLPDEGAAQWISPQFGEEYPAVDQRCILYAIGQIFKWDKTTSPSDSLTSVREDEYQLAVKFYPQNTFIWLIETGNLIVANIELSLKHCHGFGERPHIPSGQLVAAIVAIDPEMSLLHSLISKSFLSADELLHAVRLLMQSLEIFDAGSRGLLLANGESMDGLINGDAEAQLEKEETAAEMALETAEYHLGDGSSVRSQALSMALARLYSCPASSVVSALQNVFTTSETVSLIQLLRYELAVGSWTARYLDVKPTEDEVDDDADSPNNSIVMLSNLLNCCIDAIGTGGWLLADSTLIDGNQHEAEDLIESLKLEVSAALQGIDEATYIKGLTGEIIRFGKALQKALPANERNKGVDNASTRVSRPSRPVLLPANEKASAVLPIGLKAGQHIPMQRVGAGGEIKARSKRDIGRLKSQKVGKYSLERIVI